MSIDEPVHRFYQPIQWAQHPAAWENRFQSTVANPGGNRSGGNQSPRLQQLLQDEQHEFFAQPYSELSELKKMFHPNPQGEVPPVGPSNDLKMTSSVRVAWLQQNLYQLPKALSLRTRFFEAGMQVNIHQWSIDDVAPLACDLILFECFDVAEQEMMNFLLKLRFFTQAPLIILTDNYALDWSIWALRGGADAVFTVNMPDEVIVARSNALLRRWVSQ